MADTPAPTDHAHVVALDGLRGIAIALVVVHNLATVGHAPFPIAMRIIHPAFTVGWIGVQLFFVLSGFLITGILLDSKHRARMLRSFYARRALRIFPLYYVALIVYFVVVPAFGVALPTTGEVWYWTYLANWTMPAGVALAGLSHFWSLCVEEQFYLFWPLIVSRLGARGLAWLCGALAAISLATRIALIVGGGPEMGPYMYTTSRMDALALGALCALLVRSPARWARVAPRLVPAAIAGALVLVAIAIPTSSFERDNPWVQTLGYSVLAVEGALLVLLAVRERAAVRGVYVRVLRSWPLTQLGKYSYAIYVIHLPLHVVLAPHVTDAINSGGGLKRVGVLCAYEAGVLALSIVGALVSWQLLEKRLLALKRHFTVGAATAAPASPADADAR